MKKPYSSSDSYGISRRKFILQSSILGAAAASGILFPSKGYASMADSFPVVETIYGKVRGMSVAGIATFRGIRYGASTAGANRFMPPVKPTPWKDVYDAFAYGPASPQTPSDPTDPYVQSVDWDAHVKSGISEDCLVLNVWTPGLNDGGRRPVFFYIHGGGFTNGSGGATFDGDPLARMADAVVITVNHRLGPFGYLDLGKISTKFAASGVAGMLDLVAALEWVRDNIERFGGDPGNIMIFGQSGGGSKVSTLMVMPTAKGLFHKALVQSGSTLTLSPRERNTEQAGRLLSELGVSKPEDLQKLPWNVILEAKSNSGFSPVVDGTVIPKNPFDPQAPEISADIPMIVGYTREDSGIRDLKGPELTDDGLVSWVNETYKNNAPTILSTYRKVYPNATPLQVQARIRTDGGTRERATMMVERKAAQNKGKSYFYVVEWPSPAYEGRFGACHGVDLGLVLANARNLIAGNSLEARKMADIVGSAVAAFGKTGDPNCSKIPYWPAYNSESRPTMIFDLECRVENDPTRELRLLWEGMA
ncbi:MAG TPA: carboxylesterase family protein [Bacteroidales bacterium]|nr:carboxylesterase family protein [Bacteroidales bacterium]